MSMQYHLTRRARSREVRLLGGRVPFAFFASSRAVAIATTHQDPHHKVKRSTGRFWCGTCRNPVRRRTRITPHRHHRAR
ncbi:exported protein of unknown function [Methanoculleus bourgensis]|uniref:Uncharacterized protein n=1 Tax=Methanoculleus bourgensis TaxID=83986 RepID=A0A0X3BP02_9EURY|nr:exported protein of unknown function [Methanoculleus bourgensis]